MGCQRHAPQAGCTTWLRAPQLFSLASSYSAAWPSLDLLSCLARLQASQLPDPALRFSVAWPGFQLLGCLAWLPASQLPDQRLSQLLGLAVRDAGGTTDRPGTKGSTSAISLK